MKKMLFVSAVLLAVAAAALGQEKAPDFSGSWKLDAGKSKLDERSRIESITMTVTQTDAELTVTTATTRSAAPGGGGGGIGGGGRGGGFGGGGGGDGTTKYSLNGKETTVEQPGPNGNTPVTLKAKFDANKLKLSSSRTFNSPQGEISISTRDEWSLSEDGKTLTVKRSSETPRGNNTSTMVFNKN